MGGRRARNYHEHRSYAPPDDSVSLGAENLPIKLDLLRMALYEEGGNDTEISLRCVPIVTTNAIRQWRERRNLPPNQSIKHQQSRGWRRIHELAIEKARRELIAEGAEL